MPSRVEVPPYNHTDTLSLGAEYYIILFHSIWIRFRLWYHGAAMDLQQHFANFYFRHLASQTGPDRKRLTVVVTLLELLT